MLEEMFGPICGEAKAKAGSDIFLTSLQPQ